MSSTKNPEHEAENPAPMPQSQQGHKPSPHKTHMAPRADAPPGLEQDGEGNTIPIDQRTKDDQEKARSGHK